MKLNLQHHQLQYILYEEKILKHHEKDKQKLQRRAPTMDVVLKVTNTTDSSEKGDKNQQIRRQ